MTTTLNISARFRNTDETVRLACLFGEGMTRFHLDGYTFGEQIYKGSRSSVHKGIRLMDRRPVIIKVHTEVYPSEEILLRFQREFEIGASLKHTNIVEYLSLEKWGHGLAIIEEDFNGISIDQTLDGQKYDMKSFLDIAVQVARGLIGIHDKHVMHRDITPGNLVVDPQSGVAKIIDFGLSSELVRESENMTQPGRLEGTLRYLSPEQTGRMNRGIDYRTDFYSLGATFYEMLCGQPPFSQTDPLELIHAHIARPPVHPRKHNPLIPETLSEIILKLMVKNAEERYQSARGLLFDLETCAEQLEREGVIGAFTIGSKDTSSRFMIPQELYGREMEREHLLAAWDRVMRGSSEIVLVTGYSGIGKSSLVRELYKPVVAGKGFFVSGKFDQFQRQMPYAAPVDALRKLLRSLLTESEEQLAQWRSRLLEAMDGEEYVLASLLPQILQVMEEEYKPVNFEATTGRKRICLAFCRLIRALAFDRPLVLFLDDLQWLDGGTVELLKILCLQDVGQLMLIGSYRSNEVEEGHPLALALEFLQQEDIAITRLELGALSESHMQHLVGDTLESSDVAPLVKLIADKTAGNPFFVTEFLKQLHARGHLRFDHSEMQWAWDLTEIGQMEITDNVVDMMETKLTTLPIESRHLLQLAACIGHDIQLGMLFIAAERSLEQIVADLWPAVREGFIGPDETLAPWLRHHTRLEVLPESLLSSIISFRHDRVQQAAYHMIETGDLSRVHYRIGEILLQSLKPEELEEKLFDVVPHLVQGMALEKERDKKLRLARLFYKAGHRALRSAAFDTASDYLNASIEILPGDAWDDYYQDIFNATWALARARYGLVDLKGSDAFYELLLEKVRDQQHEVELITEWYDCREWHVPWSAIKKRALHGLTLCGCPFPEEEGDWPDVLEQEREKAERLLAGRKISDVLIHMNLEKVKTGPERDNRIDRTLNLLTRCMNKGFGLGNPILHEMCFLKGLNMLMENPDSQLHLAFTMQCAVAQSTKGNYESVIELTKFLLQKIPSSSGFARPYWYLSDVAAVLMPWCEHLTAIRDVFMENARMASGVGDHFGVILNRGNALFYLYAMGEPLVEVWDYTSDLYQLSVKKKFPASFDLCLGYQQLILTLQGHYEPDFFTEASFGTESWERMTKTNIRLQIFHCEIQALFWMGRYEEALRGVHRDDPDMYQLSGYIHVHEHHFFGASCAIRCYRNATPRERETLMVFIKKQYHLVCRSASACPANFLQGKLLIRAELAIIEHQPAEQICALFEDAIKTANKNGFIQYEALANERFAEYWLSTGFDQIAAPYLREACYLYNRWGAMGRVELLGRRYESRFRKRINPFLAPEPMVITTTIHHSTSGGPCVDLETVLRAARAISSEMDSSRLLPKMMRTILEGTGARRGFLILKEEQGLLVQARADINEHRIKVLEGLPIESCDDFSEAIVRYVIRSGESRLLPDFRAEDIFVRDPWLKKRPPRSTLCTPILYKDRILGALYLENELSLEAFTSQRVEVLSVLLGQASAALENASLFEDLSKLNATAGDANLALATEMEERARDETAIRRLNDILEQRVREKTTQLELARRGLLEKAHKAGMADIATSVLHNVGNLLNSVMISSEVIRDVIKASKIDSLQRANTVMHSISKVQLEAYDSRSTQLACYYEALSNMLKSDHDSIKENITRIEDKVEEVRAVVSSQERYISSESPISEILELQSVLEEVLDIMTGRLSRALVKTRKIFAPGLRVEAQRFKLTHVIMNLLENAAHALESRPSRERRLVIETGLSEPSAFIKISDNGVGIAREHLNLIFNHGFTTRSGSHGFGLHSSANIISAMGGGISVESEGLDKGATFIIQLPLGANQSLDGM